MFNEDYTYSCNLAQNISLNNTTIYKKIMNIKGIAKYGSSDYNNVDGNEDWIKIEPKKILIILLKMKRTRLLILK